MTDKSIWFYNSKDKPHGVALLIHGLNTKPSKMNELAQILVDNQMDVYRAALYEADQLSYSVSDIKEQWYEEAQKGYLITSQRAAELNVPLYFVGFSLGALMGLKILLREENAHFDKMILLAPAIASHKYVQVIGSIMAYFKSPSTPLKSIASSEYILSSSIPLAAYLAVAESMEELWSNASERLNKPCLIILDPKDELISLSKLHQFKKQFNLSHWHIKEVSNRSSKYKNKYHHLIIDEQALGSSQWMEMKIAIDGFLNSLFEKGG